MAVTPGSMIAGYRVVEVLGSGGMGDVYLVENPQLHRREAMKVISSGTSNQDFLTRFTNEARSAAALDHPSIVTVYAYGVDDDTPWFTMRHLRGPDLSKTRLNPADAVEAISQVAAALDYAHSKHVVHRDIKPANIIATRTDDGVFDRAVILDFGIVKLADSPQLTAVNTVVGTAAYTAPEIIGGSPASGASDQYSLACTAYQLFSGHVPFNAESATAMMMAHMQQPPPSLARVRPELAPLSPVLERGMAKNPADRYQSCRAFADALKAALAQVGSGVATTVTPIASLPATQYPSGSGQHSNPQHSNPQHSNPQHSNPQQFSGGQQAPGSYGSGANYGAPQQYSGQQYSNPQQYAGQPYAGQQYSNPQQSSPQQFAGMPQQPGTPGWETGSSSSDGKSRKGLWIGLGALAAVVILVAGTSPLWWPTSGEEEPAGPLVSAGQQISVRAGGSCTISEQKELWCWGVNEFGQLGDGSTAARKTPTKVPGLTNVTAVSISGYRTDDGRYPATACAVADGDAWCWGSNASGELGTGNTDASDSPVKVNGLGKVDTIVHGYATTCAVTQGEQEVYCWGFGTSGQIGHGSKVQDEKNPTKVNGLSGVTALAGDGASFCAVAQAKLHCWGNNASGQLGIGNTDDQTSPTEVANLNDVSAVAMGYSRDDQFRVLQSTCAVAEKKVYCWGAAWGNRKVPGEITGVSDAEQVTVDVGTVCATTTEHELYCWGNNRFGQVGNNSTERADGPVKISGVPGVFAVSTGTSSTCARGEEEGVESTYCWGISWDDSEDRHTPQKVDIPTS